MTKIDESRDDLPEIVVVVNGALGMGEGKKIGQAFQAAARVLMGGMDPGIYLDFCDWSEIGTRTIVKQAKTQAMFDRIVAEVPGYVMVDEGFTEVEPGTPTVFASYPFLHKNRPRILDGKKVPLL